MQRILVVDDDPALVRLVSEVLGTKGYQVTGAGNGLGALRAFFDQKPDLVLLDVVMPGMDGWQTCGRIREVSDVPIIMITGQKNTEDDVVTGLDHGADEYLVKPIGNRELVARVRAALRRAEFPAKTNREARSSFEDDFLSVSVAERKVSVSGQRVKLTATEFKLLALLLQNAGRVLTHRQILEKVWGWEYIDDVDYVRIYVAHLRRKLEKDASQPRYILTEPGVGYLFRGVRT